MSPEALAIARDFLSQRRNNSEFTPDLIPPEHFPEGTDEEKDASEKRRLAAGPKWTLRPGRTFAPEAVSDKEYAKDYDAAGQNTDEEREANTKEYKKRLRSAKRKANFKKAQTAIDAQFPNGVNAWEVGAKAGDSAQTYRARAAEYGNSAQDEQKVLYDAAESAQGVHDKVPGWVAQNAPANIDSIEEPTIPTWAEIKQGFGSQTRIDNGAVAVGAHPVEQSEPELKRTENQVQTLLSMVNAWENLSHDKVQRETGGVPTTSGKLERRYLRERGTPTSEMKPRTPVAD